MKKRAIIFVLLAITCLMQSVAPARSTVVLDEDSDVVILANDYMNDNETINVYSNRSVQEYSLKLNGTTINSDANPVPHQKGYWYPCYYIMSRGTGINNSIHALYEDDGDRFYIDSEQSFFRERVIVDFYFSTECLTVPVDTITTTKLTCELLIRQIGSGLPSVRQLQIYNLSTASYTTLYDFPVATGGTVNQTVTNLVGNVAHYTNVVIIRLNLEATSSSYDFDTFTDYLNIYYESSMIADSEHGFELVDTYVLETALYADGLYNLTAIVKDNYNVTYNYTKWVVIDNTDPSIASVTVSPSILNTTTPTSITAIVTDTNLNNSYGIYVNQLGDTVQIPNGVNNLFNYTDYFTNGTYTFILYATDFAGNFKIVNTSFTVDYVLDVEYVQVANVSAIITYPSVVYKTTVHNVSIETMNSTGFDNSIYINNTFINSTFYTGNITHQIPVPTDEVSTVVFSIDLYNDTGSVVNTVNVTINVLAPVLPDNNIIIYDTILFPYEHFYLRGIFESIYNVSVYKNDAFQMKYENVTGFNYTYATTFADIGTSFKIYFYMKNGSSLIFESTVTVYVTTGTGGGGRGGGSDTGGGGPEPPIEIPILTFGTTEAFILLAIIIGGSIGGLLLFNFLRQRRMQSVKKNGSRKTRGKKTSSSKKKHARAIGKARTKARSFSSMFKRLFID